ncbi:beta-hexosaminidase [Enterococcus sp. 669A]|uniref:Beta-hexosaminidase n=1 Tax=Candidatus Enterococcus moelleringii TaxID=2815325 RepID=A0ABS3LGZ3_9ENTE|nr:glycoside hydrolase family 3 N-terminal domain-containing protein [Enterococcus sp. 669A]MBO1308893.1 beta-hexosaminidase [Enterococcus sp. 669A]
MVKKKTMIGFTILLALILSACSTNSKTSDTRESQTSATSEMGAPALTSGEKVKQTMDQMTLEEKVGQLFLVRVPAENQLEDIQTYHLGGYLLFDRDMEGETRESLQQKIAGYQAASKYPMLIASDEEGGLVSRLSRNKLVDPPFASPQTLYQENGWQAITDDINRKAEVFHELGIQAGMAPDADVSTDPESFIYDRTIGMDAAGTSEYVTKSVEAMKQVKIGSTLKHFPGYGNNRDSHVEIVTDDRSMDELRGNDFLPFQAGIAAGADSIMVSHNIVNAIDRERPASISPKVHEVIRQELGFDGIVMTDDMDMAGLAAFTSQEEAGLQALQAGNDLILSSSYSTQIPYILQAIQEGEYTEDQLNQSVERVLKWKVELGLFK